MHLLKLKKSIVRDTKSLKKLKKAASLRIDRDPLLFGCLAHWE